MVRSPKYPSAMTTSYATDQIELAVRLRLAVMRLTRMLRQQEDGGVSNSALSALATLEREGALTLGDLAAREHVQPPTMTRIAQALVENGLVRRLEDGADRRVTRVRITQTGMKVLARSRRRKEELLATRLRGLSARDLETLADATRILDRLTGGEP